MSKKKFKSHPRLVKKGKVVKVADAIEKIQRLQEQMDAAKNEAIGEVQEKRKALLVELNDLDKQLAALTGDKPRAGGIKRVRDPNKPCPVCGEKGHDGRFHRSKKKK